MHSISSNKESSNSRRYTGLSIVAIFMMLGFHILHWIAAPLLASLSISSTDSHHHMHSTANSGYWVVIIIGISVVSIGFACKQLASAWRAAHRTRHLRVCSGISIFSLLIAGYTLFTL